MPKVIRGNLSVIRSISGAEIVPAEFPIDLILVVRHENRATYDTCSRSHLHDGLDAAEKDVEICKYFRSITSLGKGEIGTITSIGGDLIRSTGPIRGHTGILREIDEIRTRVEPCVRTTSC